MDHKRPRNKPFFGAIVPARATPSTAAVSHAAPIRRSTLPTKGCSSQKVRHLVRPRSGKRPRWQKRWKSIQRVELRLTPTRMVLVRRGGARSSSR